MEVVTKYQWDELDANFIRNPKYGEFRRCQDLWLFVGSYGDATWEKLWHSRYLADKDFRPLLKTVESLIDQHKRTERSRVMSRVTLILSLTLCTIVSMLILFAVNGSL